MRVGGRLGGWLNDPAAQAAALDISRSTASAIHRLPGPAAFRERLRAGPGTVAAVEDLVAGLFADRAWLTDAVALMTDALAADPFALPPFLTVDGALYEGLVLHDCPLVTVAIGTGGLAALARHKARTGPASVNFTGRRQQLCFVHTAGVRLKLFRLTGDRAVAAGHLSPRDGEVVTIDGRDTAWVIDHAAGDLVLLQATIKPGAAPLAVECDAATGAIVARSTTDEGASRMQVLISLLGAMERRDAVPALRRCLTEPAAWLRWHAMRELTALDPDGALEPLDRLAAADPDGEVRAAARATRAILCPA